MGSFLGGPISNLPGAPGNDPGAPATPLRGSAPPAPPPTAEDWVSGKDIERQRDAGPKSSAPPPPPDFAVLELLEAIRRVMVAYNVDADTAASYLRDPSLVQKRDQATRDFGELALVELEAQAKADADAERFRQAEIDKQKEQAFIEGQKRGEFDLLTPNLNAVLEQRIREQNILQAEQKRQEEIIAANEPVAPFLDAVRNSTPVPMTAEGFQASILDQTALTPQAKADVLAVFRGEKSIQDISIPARNWIFTTAESVRKYNLEQGIRQQLRTGVPTTFDDPFGLDSKAYLEYQPRPGDVEHNLLSLGREADDRTREKGTFDPLSISSVVYSDGAAITPGSIEDLTKVRARHGIDDWIITVDPRYPGGSETDGAPIIKVRPAAYDVPDGAIETLMAENERYVSVPYSAVTDVLMRWTADVIADNYNGLSDDIELYLTQELGLSKPQAQTALELITRAAHWKDSQRAPDLQVIDKARDTVLQTFSAAEGLVGRLPIAAVLPTWPVTVAMIDAGSAMWNALGIKQVPDVSPQRLMRWTISDAAGAAFDKLSYPAEKYQELNGALILNVATGDTKTRAWSGAALAGMVIGEAALAYATKGKTLQGGVVGRGITAAGIIAPNATRVAQITLAAEHLDPTFQESVKDLSFSEKMALGRVLPSALIIPGRDASIGRHLQEAKADAKQRGVDFDMDAFVQQEQHTVDTLWLIPADPLNVLVPTIMPGGPVRSRLLHSQLVEDSRPIAKDEYIPLGQRLGDLGPQSIADNLAGMLPIPQAPIVRVPAPLNQLPFIRNSRFADAAPAVKAVGGAADEAVDATKGVNMFSQSFAGPRIGQSINITQRFNQEVVPQVLSIANHIAKDDPAAAPGVLWRVFREFTWGGNKANDVLAAAKARYNLPEPTMIWRQFEDIFATVNKTEIPSLKKKVWTGTREDFLALTAKEQKKYHETVNHLYANFAGDVGRLAERRVLTRFGFDPDNLPTLYRLQRMQRNAVGIFLQTPRYIINNFVGNVVPSFIDGAGVIGRFKSDQYLTNLMGEAGAAGFATYGVGAADLATETAHITPTDKNAISSLFGVIFGSGPRPAKRRISDILSVATRISARMEATHGKALIARGANQMVQQEAKYLMQGLVPAFYSPDMVNDVQKIVDTVNNGQELENALRLKAFGNGFVVDRPWVLRDLFRADQNPAVARFLDENPLMEDFINGELANTLKAVKNGKVSLAEAKLDVEAALDLVNQQIVGDFQKMVASFELDTELWTTASLDKIISHAETLANHGHFPTFEAALHDAMHEPLSKLRVERYTFNKMEDLASVAEEVNATDIWLRHADRRYLIYENYRDDMLKSASEWDAAGLTFGMTTHETEELGAARRLRERIHAATVNGVTPAERRALRTKAVEEYNKEVEIIQKRAKERAKNAPGGEKSLKEAKKANPELVTRLMRERDERTLRYRQELMENLQASQDELRSYVTEIYRENESYQDYINRLKLVSDGVPTHVSKAREFKAGDRLVVNTKTAPRPTGDATRDAMDMGDIVEIDGIQYKMAGWDGDTPLFHGMAMGKIRSMPDVLSRRFRNLTRLADPPLYSGRYEVLNVAANGRITVRNVITQDVKSFAMADLTQMNAVRYRASNLGALRGDVNHTLKERRNILSDTERDFFNTLDESRTMTDLSEEERAMVAAVRTKLGDKYKNAGLQRVRAAIAYELNQTEEMTARIRQIVNGVDGVVTSTRGKVKTFDDTAALARVMGGVDPADIPSILEAKLVEALQWRTVNRAVGRELGDQIDSLANTSAKVLTPEEAKLHEQFVKELVRRRNELNDRAIRYGVLVRDFVLHNYQNTYNWDYMLRWIFPWHLWMTRSYAKYGVRLLDHPNLFANVEIFSDFIQERHKKLKEEYGDGYFFEKMLPLPLPFSGFLPKYLQGDLYTSSWQNFLPVGFLDDYHGNEERENVLAKVLGTFNDAGLGTNPYLMYLLRAGGVFGDDAKNQPFGNTILPQETLINTMTYFTNKLIPVMPVDIRYTDSDYRYTKAIIAQMAIAGEITEVQANDALYELSLIQSGKKGRNLNLFGSTWGGIYTDNEVLKKAIAENAKARVTRENIGYWTAISVNAYTKDDKAIDKLLTEYFRTIESLPEHEQKAFRDRFIKENPLMGTFFDSMGTGPKLRNVALSKWFNEVDRITAEYDAKIAALMAENSRDPEIDALITAKFKAVDEAEAKIMKETGLNDLFSNEEAARTFLNTPAPDTDFLGQPIDRLPGYVKPTLPRIIKQMYDNISNEEAFTHEDAKGNKYFDGDAFFKARSSFLNALPDYMRAELMGSPTNDTPAEAVTNVLKWIYGAARTEAFGAGNGLVGADRSKAIDEALNSWRPPNRQQIIAAVKENYGEQFTDAELRAVISDALPGLPADLELSSEKQIKRLEETGVGFITQSGEPVTLTNIDRYRKAMEDRKNFNAAMETGAYASDAYSLYWTDDVEMYFGNGKPGVAIQAAIRALDMSIDSTKASDKRAVLLAEKNQLLMAAKLLGVPEKGHVAFDNANLAINMQELYGHYTNDLVRRYMDGEINFEEYFLKVKELTDMGIVFVNGEKKEGEAAKAVLTERATSYSNTDSARSIRDSGGGTSTGTGGEGVPAKTNYTVSEIMEKPGFEAFKQQLLEHSFQPGDAIPKDRTFAYMLDNGATGHNEIQRLFQDMYTMTQLDKESPLAKETRRLPNIKSALFGLSQLRVRTATLVMAIDDMLKLFNLEPQFENMAVPSQDEFGMRLAAATGNFRVTEDTGSPTSTTQSARVARAQQDVGRVIANGGLPGAPALVYGVTSWDDVKAAARTLFGGTDVIEEIIYHWRHGGKVPDATMRKIRFMAAVIPINDARNLNQWLAGLQLIYQSDRLFNSGGAPNPPRSRFPTAIRERRF